MVDRTTTKALAPNSWPISYVEDSDQLEIILSHPNSPEYNMLITLNPQFGQGAIYPSYAGGRTNQFGGRVPITAPRHDLGLYGLAAKYLYRSAARYIGKALVNGARIDSITGGRRYVAAFIREAENEWSGEAAREEAERKAAQRYCKDCRYFSIIGCKHPDPKSAGCWSRHYRNRNRQYIYSSTKACQKGFTPK